MNNRKKYSKNNKITPVSFYDNAFNESEYLVNWETSPQKFLFLALSEMVESGSSVVELGCGTGQFAELLYSIGISKYRGYDWSSVGIAKCRERCPSLFFEVRNICFDIPNISSEEIVIASEFLEHIPCDLGLLSQIPSKTSLIISLPLGMCSSHLRCFPTIESVKIRYEPVIDFISDIMPIEIEGTKKWWYFKGSVK